MDYAHVSRSVAEDGFVCLGGFRPRRGDGVPGTDESKGTVIIVGNAGPALWAHFSPARRDEPDPLDAWTRRTLDPVASALGARALFPFDGPPYFPFQRWAVRTGAAHPSPTGPLIHGDYGLWHALRAAFVFDEDVAGLPPPGTRASPCETCRDAPCLTACPIGAFVDGGPGGGGTYDVGGCAEHLASGAGRACMDGGCLARSACPVGRDFAYAPEQARHHMERFVAARGT